MSTRLLDWKIIVPILGGVVFGFILAAGTLGFGTSSSPGKSHQTLVNAKPPSDLGPDEQRNIEIFKRVAPSVVNIYSKAIRQSLFSRNPMEVDAGTGTGFIWNDDGFVVTNYHVVMGASFAEVTLLDNTTYKTKWIRKYPDKDIAVLKIDAPKSKLTPIELGQSANLLVGQKVLAIGNPFGYDHTLTTGVVSALGREILSVNKTIIIDVIQTDTDINPGNSGGPLLDSSGRVIGVNTAIVSPSQANAGLGFSIPVDIVKKIVPQLIEFGTVKPLHPILGIFPRNSARVQGVLIDKVDEKGGAAAAGLRGIQWNSSGKAESFDIITEIDGQRILRLAELQYVLEKHKVGDVVEVGYYRDGETKKTRVKLSNP